MNRPGRFLFPLAFFLLAGYFLYNVRDSLFPFLLAAAAAYIFNPAVNYCEARGLRRVWAVLVIYGSLAGLLAFGAFTGVSAASSEAAKARTELPLFFARTQASLKEWKDVRSGARRPHTPLQRQLKNLEKLPGFDAVSDYVEENWQGWAGSALKSAPSMALLILPVLELLCLVPFIAFFFMVEGPDIIHGFLDMVPAHYVETLLGLMSGIEHALGSYVRGIVLEASLVGLAALAGFWVIGLDYAIQVSVAMGVANLIPYVGPVVGSVLGGGLALYQWGTPAALVKVLGVCVGVKFFDDWVLQPVIIKNAVELHPVLVLFALMCGGALGGFWGLLFAVPAACMVKVCLEVGWDWYRSEFGLRLADADMDVSRIPPV